MAGMLAYLRHEPAGQYLPDRSDGGGKIHHRTPSFRAAEQGIPLIFEIEGEAGFRSRESSVLDELTRQSNLVLATGGGVVLSPDNRKILHERGVVVYLHAPLETLLQRTHRDRHRPLLQTADRRRTLEDILKAREPIYRQTADMVIETSHRSPVSVAREIARKLEALQTDENAAS